MINYVRGKNFDNMKEMSDKELDKVAGGTFEELKRDATELEESFPIGARKYMPFAIPTGIGNMKYYNHEAVIAAFAKCGVRMTFDMDKPNEYFIGDNKVTQEEALAHVKSKLGVN